MSCPNLKTQYDLYVQKLKTLDEAISESIASGDFSRPQLIKQEILEIKERLEEYRTQKLRATLPTKEDPNQKEQITIDLKETLERSKQMLREIIDNRRGEENRDIREFFEKLLATYPKRVRISKEYKQRLEHDMERHNLRGSLIIPHIPSDKRTLFIRGISGTKVPELEGKTGVNNNSIQYQEPFITEKIEEYEEDEREGNFSLYLYSKESVAQNTKGRGLTNLRETYWRDPEKERTDPNDQENNQKPHRTTLIGTLMEMREMAKENAEESNPHKHAINNWNNTSESNAVWTGDMMQTALGDVSLAVRAYWNLNARQVWVNWARANIRNLEIGARPAAIAPILTI